MYRTVVVAVLACLAAPAQAHQKTTPSVIQHETVTQIALQKTSEVVKVSVTRGASEAPIIKESMHAGASGWGKYGTVLATLVVMCAIALRRQRLGRR